MLTALLTYPEGLLTVKSFSLAGRSAAVPVGVFVLARVFALRRVAGERWQAVPALASVVRVRSFSRAYPAEPRKGWLADSVRLSDAALFFASVLTLPHGLRPFPAVPVFPVFPGSVG